ncbi:DNA/RNA nuclease SfsA [Trichlorobacter ammonificans]|uniref:Sugar fermentation stimulation protein homolog n=1 Tax=Trichlorobacter ammonificans TaxID=2916410 RepID=A0ABM9D5T6_9BACT|nr:DNA/RNA nuclease SfsA [Trichlorobacter ammonificans]CAH2030270.1 putative DNA-binding transcriptional regulator of maltose metabolism [Trichlorobacter ammonificans]
MLLPPLIPGRLVRRYQRFLADIELADGSVVTAHCPNSGSMKGCNHPGSPVFLSLSANPARKLAHTWELVQVNGFWVGLNTMLPNRLAEEAILDGTVQELQGYGKLRREVTYGRERSRIDLLLEGERGRCYVEVKNVTLVEEGRALFPDAVTERGQKHLRELMEMVTHGHRAVIFFTVQRGDGTLVAPADAIDPAYGRLLREAVQNGVEALAYRAEVTPQQIRLTERLPVVL